MTTTVTVVDESHLPILAVTTTKRPLFPALSSAHGKSSNYGDDFTNVSDSSSTLNSLGSRIPRIPLLAFWRLMEQILCVIDLLENNPGKEFYI